MIVNANIFFYDCLSFYPDLHAPNDAVLGPRAAENRRKKLAVKKYWSNFVTFRILVRLYNNKDCFRYKGDI